MSEGVTAQDSAFKSKEQAEEARYIREKVLPAIVKSDKIPRTLRQEATQLAAMREEAAKSSGSTKDQAGIDHDFEGGFGGQEDLEDRYATTSGEH